MNPKPKILLRAPSIKKGIIHHRPPLGLHLIASFLRDRGYPVEVLDSLLDDVDPREAAKRYDFLGQSSLYHSLPEDVLWVNRAKQENPDLFAFFGGPGAVLDLNFIFAHSEADGVYQGENPEDLLAVFEGSPYNAPGFILRVGRPVAFTQKKWERTWGLMDWRNIPLERYWGVLDSLGWSHQKTIHLITSTHCPKNCAFCTFPALRRQYNLHPEMCYQSNTAICDTIIKIKQFHPEMEQVFFHDDDFFGVATRDKFFDECLNTFSGISFLIQASPESMKGPIRKKLPTLKQAGVHTLCVGVENVASRVLGKKVDQEFLIDLARDLIANKITPYYYMMIFTPDETMESLRENLGFSYRVQAAGGQVSIALGVWALTGTNLTERYEASKVMINMDGHPVPYKTTLRVHDPQVEKIRQRVWQEIDVINNSTGGFISKQVYVEQLLSKIEKEINSIHPHDLYKEIR